jgi:hypothetical protein
MTAPPALEKAMRYLLLATFLAAAAAAAEFPSAEISNGVVTAKLYLPDAERGYYRGTRFDWSGVIYSLRAGGHEYFGQWFPRYDPKLHDAIMGPVEEFSVQDGGPGYAEARPGGGFLRIGVGVLRKIDEAAFQHFKTYDIIDFGKWTVRKGANWIAFEHELRGANGYAYRYTKTVRLVEGKPEMVIEHSLRNTGTKAIEASLYDHNFFVMDGAPTGPDASVEFPFELRPVRAFEGGLAEARGRRIVFLKELQQGQSVFGEFDGPGGDASNYNIHLEHKGAGAGVEITGDRPLSKLLFWSIRTTFCPEPYIHIAVEPGKETQWMYRYRFYSVPPRAR